MSRPKPQALCTSSPSTTAPTSASTISAARSTPPAIAEASSADALTAEKNSVSWWVDQLNIDQASASVTSVR